MLINVEATHPFKLTNLLQSIQDNVENYKINYNFKGVEYIKEFAKILDKYQDNGSEEDKTLYLTDDYIFIKNINYEKIPAGVQLVDLNSIKVSNNFIESGGIYQINNGKGYYPMASLKNKKPNHGVMMIGQNININSFCYIMPFPVVVKINYNLYDLDGSIGKRLMIEKLYNKNVYNKYNEELKIMEV